MSLLSLASFCQSRGSITIFEMTVKTGENEHQHRADIVLVIFLFENKFGFHA